MTDFTVVVPTCNERESVGQLVDELRSHLRDFDAEVIFVDDSCDGTADALAVVARTTLLPIHIVRRTSAVGQLAGAVLVGLLLARSPWVVVMDGDLQHPPEGVRRLIELAKTPHCDLVVASRYMDGGGLYGLDGRLRQVVTETSTRLIKALFRERLRGCTDPLTGFFAVRRAAVRLEDLNPSGFKILLEILLTNDLKVSEIALALEPRLHGESKASVSQGLRLVRQLMEARLAGRRRQLGTNLGSDHRSRASLQDELCALGAPSALGLVRADVGADATRDVSIGIDGTISTRQRRRAVTRETTVAASCRPAGQAPAVSGDDKHAEGDQSW